MPLFEVQLTYEDSTGAQAALVTRRYDGTLAALLKKLNQVVPQANPQIPGATVGSFTVRVLPAAEAIVE